MILFSKKAQLGEQIIMFAFMLLLGIVGGGIVIGTYLYIGGGYDFRAGHAGLLGSAIGDCINQGFDVRRLGRTNDADTQISWLAGNCSLNAESLRAHFRIKICTGVGSYENCINDEAPILSYGDVIPCSFEENERKQFLGCAFVTYGTEYTIVTATNQRLGRRAS